jgi:phosphoglycerate dehydrogenase-like enzyme
MKGCDVAETIAFLQPLTDEMREVVESCAPPGLRVASVTSTDPEHQRTLIAGAHYAVVWDVGVDETLLRAGTRLKLLHKWGVGVDNLDLDAARRLGIAVARTTGGNAVPVAEFTIAAMLALARRLIPANEGMQQGRWLKNEIWRESVMLFGRTVGIVGLGTIGTEVAKRLAAFGCRILYYKPNRLGVAEERALEVEFVSLADLLQESDIVTLHCPLTAATRGLMGADALRRMKQGAILINVARGGVVSEPDLVHALRTGHLAAAAVDVFETEPIPADHPFIGLPNVLLTPHCAATTFDNSRKGIARLMDNVARFSRGEEIPARDVVVPPPGAPTPPHRRTSKA